MVGVLPEQTQPHDRRGPTIQAHNKAGSRGTEVVELKVNFWPSRLVM